MKHKKSVTVVAGAIMAVGMAAPAFADSDANSAATGSAGLVSGNAALAPVHVPANLCGDSVDGIALLNPAFGNSCVGG